VWHQPEIGWIIVTPVAVNVVHIVAAGINPVSKSIDHP